MKISLQILTIIMFFGLNASAGAFPLVQIDHKSSLLVKIKVNKQCMSDHDMDAGCTSQLDKCFTKKTGIPNNRSLKSIKEEMGADEYNNVVRYCKQKTDFEGCWQEVKKDCSG